MADLPERIETVAQRALAEAAARVEALLEEFKIPRTSGICRAIRAAILEPAGSAYPPVGEADSAPVITGDWGVYNQFGETLGEGLSHDAAVDLANRYTAADVEHSTRIVRCS